MASMENNRNLESNNGSFVVETFLFLQNIWFANLSDCTGHTMEPIGQSNRSQHSRLNRHAQQIAWEYNEPVNFINWTLRNNVWNLRHKFSQKNIIETKYQTVPKKY